MTRLMRRLRFRLNLRTGMVIIALVAVALEVEVARRRWVFHRAKAAEFRLLEQGLLWLAGREEAKAQEARRKAEDLEEQARAAGQRALGKDALDVAEVEYQKNSLEIANGVRKDAVRHAMEAEDNRLSATDYGRLGRLHENAASRPWLRPGSIEGPRSILQLRDAANAGR